MKRKKMAVSEEMTNSTRRLKLFVISSLTAIFFLFILFHLVHSHSTNKKTVYPTVRHKRCISKWNTNQGITSHMTHITVVLVELKE